MLDDMRAEGFPLTHDALVAELDLVRSNGLVRLRHAAIPTLRYATVLAGYAREGENAPLAVEALLRHGVARLGGGRLEEAAGYTYGLIQGTRDWPAADRRREGAKAYSVSVDRFRKHYEKIVHGQVAEAIMNIIREPAANDQPDSNTANQATVRAIIDRDQSGPPRRWDATTRTLAFSQGGATFRVHIHCTSVDMLRNIDAVVCSLSTYLELSNTYKSSVAACLRRAGAVRGPTGEIVVDSVSHELDRWRNQHAKLGLPVAPGIVAPINVDPASDLWFRRIYFAAVAVPRAGTNDYDVERASIARAVHNVFRIADDERRDFEPPLASLCFPLLGAGRGGLSPRTSVAWIWDAIHAEWLSNSNWQIHFIAIHQSDADAVVDTLTGLGAVELTADPAHMVP